MIKSMTAYGRAKHSADQTDFTVEIKSVNSKYLDLSIKLPRQYTFLEDKIRGYITEKGIVRGKVEVYLGVDSYGSDIEMIAIDDSFAKAYIEALRHLRDTHSLPDDITTMKVAENRELFNIKKSECDADGMWEKVKIPLDEAIDAFLCARANEGARIEQDIRSKIANIMELTSGIDALSLADTNAKYEKLCERIRKIVARAIFPLIVIFIFQCHANGITSRVGCRVARNGIKCVFRQDVSLFLSVVNKSRAIGSRFLNGCFCNR